jgi:endonuclease YncB( thermonuclease family)
MNTVNEFQGEVIRILGTSGVEVDVRGERQFVQFSCIRIPPFIPGGGSEPFSFEARERIRRLLIGQTVSVVVDGAITERFFATLYLNGICINELLVREGFAKVIPPICGKESARFAVFQLAQEEAAAAQLGVHSPTAETYPALVVRDFSLNVFKEVALKHLSEFRNIKITGVVEDVLGGNRFAILAVREHVMVRAAVNGLLPLSPSDRLGRDAIAFCQQRYLHRDIEFTIKEVDRSGGFIADMSLIESSGQLTDIACVLLSEGLAELHHGTATTMTNYEKLQEIQDTARRDEVGKWANKSRFEPQLEFGKFYPVRITAAWTGTDVVVQFLSDVMEEIDTVIQTQTRPVSKALMKNDLVCVIYSNARYRGRVERVDETDRVTVRLIDFDIELEVAASDIYEIPQRLENIGPQALTVHLAFLKLTNDVEADRDWIMSTCKDYVLYMHLMYSNQIPCVLLCDRPSVDGGTLNSLALEKMNVRVVDLDFEFEEEYSSLLDSLRRIDHDLHRNDNFNDE